MIGRTDPLLCYNNILNRKLPAIKSLPKFKLQNNYLEQAIFLPFILYLNIEVLGRWQTRKGEFGYSVEQALPSQFFLTPTLLRTVYCNCI